MPTGPLHLLRCSLSCAMLAAAPAAAQDAVAPVIDDATAVAALLAGARSDAAQKPHEAVRQLCTVLDGWGSRLVATPGDPDLFVAAGMQAERMLLGDAALVAAFRHSEEPAALQSLADGRLDQLVATRLATGAGLEAALRLAQSALQRAQPATAASLLERISAHDGLQGARRLHHAAMLTIALARLGDLAGARDALQSAMAAAEEPGMPASAAATVAAASAEVERAAHARELVPTLGDAAAPWSEIWQAPIQPATSLQRVDIAQINQGGAGGADIQRAGAMPAADAWRIFVNDGGGVRAYDRVSGRLLWSHQTGGESLGPPVLHSVAPAGDAVVSFETPHTTRTHAGGSVLQTDAASGRVRWEHALDPSDGRGMAGGLLPVGGPVIIDGRIVVAARRTTPQQETASWLVCLDLREPGPPVWASIIATAHNLAPASLRASESPVPAGGGIFVATGTGAVARIDPATGAVVWLRRFAVPLRDARPQARQWELASPAVAMGRVFTLAPDGTRVVVLDAATGRQVLSIPTGADSPLGSPRYLVGVPGSRQVVAVGSRVIAFDAADPSTPIWHWPAEPGAIAQYSGRVTASPGTPAQPACVVVPGATATQVLAVATGRLLLELPTTGNARLLPNQVISAGAEVMRSFMPFTEAERAVRARLLVDADVGAALSCLHFALQARQGGLAAEAAAEAARRLALTGPADALPGTPDERAAAGELLAMLLALDVAGIATGPDALVIEETIDLAAAAAGQAPRAAFARAARLAGRGQAAEAARVLCALAIAEHEPGLVEHDGALATTQAHALAQLAALGVADTAVAGAAGACACAVADDADAEPGALRTAARVAHAAGNADSTARLVAALRRRDPALAGRVSLELMAHPPRATPRMEGAPSRVVEFPGRLVPVTAPSPVEAGRVFTAQGEQLMVRAAPEFEPIWKTQIGASCTCVIECGERVIAWAAGAPGHGEAIALDARTGGVLWRTGDAAALLGPVTHVGDESSEAQVEIAGGGMAPLADMMPAVCGDTLVLVRRDGAVVALDAADGTTIRWARPGGDMAVSEFATTAGAVILGGAGIDGEGVPRVRALDPLTGVETLSINLDEGFAPRLAWFRVLPGGVLAVGTEEGVEARRLAGGDDAGPLWAVYASDVQGAPAAWGVGRWLVVAGRFGQLVAIDSTTGRVAAAAFQHADMTTEPVRAIETGDGWLAVVRDESAEFYDMDGQFLGRDVAAGDRRIGAALAAHGELVVLGLRGSASTDFGSPHFEMDIVQLDPHAGGKIIGAPVGLRTIGQRMTAARAIDNWVLVSNGVFVQAVDFRKRKPEAR